MIKVQIDNFLAYPQNPFSIEFQEDENPHLILIFSRDYIIINQFDKSGQVIRSASFTPEVLLKRIFG